ncbi:MAG: hypothetical protein M3132_08980 [Actinomycetia bacterium]|nr:hypothetical protein [Actinomycetes bacterium]
MLRAGGRLVFDVVDIPRSVIDSGVSLEDYGFVASETPYEILLETAGFSGIEIEDTTAGYAAVAARWLDAIVDLEPELRRALGDDVFAEKVASRRSAFEQLEEGTLGRTLYSATA